MCGRKYQQQNLWKQKWVQAWKYQKQKIHFNISERKCSFRYDCDLYYFKYFHCWVHICNFLVCRSVGCCWIEIDLRWSSKTTRLAKREQHATTKQQQQQKPLKKAHDNFLKSPVPPTMAALYWHCFLGAGSKVHVTFHRSRVHIGHCTIDELLSHTDFTRSNRVVC